jgi:hypothetical protein
VPPSTPRFCLTGHARFTTRDFESAGEEFELAVLRWGLTDAVFDALMERFIAAAPAESEVDFQSRANPSTLVTTLGASICSRQALQRGWPTSRPTWLTARPLIY